MAGLYDDLPEPQSEQASGQVTSEKTEAHLEYDWKDVPRPKDPGNAKLFALDDVSLEHVLSFLSLLDLGNVLPAVCPLLLFLRGVWPEWRRFVQPLRRAGVETIQLLQVDTRSLAELCHLSECLNHFAAEGFRGFKPRLPSFAPDRHALSYRELPIPRVVWSLHSEGLSRWRRTCACVLEVSSALLPPWDRTPKRQLLPRKVRLLLGVSLWLPPNEVAAEHSFPSLYLNAALMDPEIFEALADRFPENPPCLAATCEALLLRMWADTSSTLEDWSWRVCFGLLGYRHPGHGDMEGYRQEIQTPGRKRWRPPELCFAREEDRLAVSSLRILLRTRRCLGLLE